jgi:cytochrome c oxidase assembly protein subunit 11
MMHKKPIYKQAGLLAGIAIAMFGFGFAMVPLYDTFCQLTGFGGRGITNEANLNETVDMDREITVEFIANVGRHAYMEFRPATVRMKVHPGEIAKTSFFARNLNKEGIISQSVYNVAPAEGSLYFNKTECFCFTQQAFEAGEEREMPLIFSISPDIPEGIRTVSLSYTIYDRTEQNKQLALANNQRD